MIKIKEDKSMYAMAEITIVITPTQNTIPNILAEGRGSEAHTFCRLALVVIFFCTDNKDRSSLIRCTRFSVSFDLIGTAPTNEQGHLHSNIEI